MPGAYIYGYDWANALWRRVRIGNLGRLEVNIIAAPAFDTHCYGWDGANWQELLVESAANANLRAKLFDGANGIDSQLINTNLSTERGLVVTATLNARMGANDYQMVRGVSLNADNRAPQAYTIWVGAALFGYDGVNFDRLRTYGTGILKVGRAEIDSTTVRLVAAGQVIAGAHNLYWLACNPAAGNSVFELSDDLDGLTAILLDCFSTSKEGKGFVFDPPMKFATGIYLKTFTNMTSVTFCYV